MININSMLNDFKTISKQIKENTETIKKQDFIIRLVICYTEDEKSRKNNEYEVLKEYTKELDNIQFDYRAKDNKYIYLLKKSEFEDAEQFKSLQEQFCKKDKNGEYSALTINLTNLYKYKSLLALVLEVLKTK